MQPERFSSRTFRNSTGWLSACSADVAVLEIVPSFLMAGSKPLATPPPIIGFSYSSTTSPPMT